jgi:hypothetical protein
MPKTIQAQVFLPSSFSILILIEFVPIAAELKNKNEKRHISCFPD